MLEFAKYPAGMCRLDDGGIYQGDSTNTKDSIVEIRKKVAAVRYDQPPEKVAKHQLPVMDHEVAGFLARIPEARHVDVDGCWGWHWRRLCVVRCDVQVATAYFMRSNLLHTCDLLSELYIIEDNI